MICADLIKELEQLAPGSFALDWDNVGLLAGRFDKEISTVMIALDATDDVIDQAVDEGVDFLLTHHPLIFKPVKRVNDGSLIGRRLINLIRNDICYYAMHTNFDVMGMADAVADELGITDRDVLEVTYEDDISKEGIGRVGSFRRAMDLESCAKLIGSCFDASPVKVFGNRDATVERVAVCPGSGKSVIGEALKAGADVLITGDIDHHAGIDAVAEGLCIIDAGHYGLEHIFSGYMGSFIERQLKGIKVIKAKESCPFIYI